MTTPDLEERISKAYEKEPRGFEIPKWIEDNCPEDWPTAVYFHRGYLAAQREAVERDKSDNEIIVMLTRDLNTYRKRWEASKKVISEVGNCVYKHHHVRSINSCDVKALEDSLCAYNSQIKEKP